MMAGIGPKNTKPELVVRQLLHRQGYRFRLHPKDLPGKPDIVLPKWNTVVFVHGCFWHGHLDCPLFRLPKSRTDFWHEKITKNQERDAAARKLLLEKSWRVVEVWECATKGRSAFPIDALSDQLVEAITSNQEFRIELRGRQIA